MYDVIKIKETQQTKGGNKMANEDNMNIQLTRLETLDVSMSIILLIHDAKSEMNSPETTEDRKKVLKGTIAKWETLRNKIKKQFEEQDI